MTQDLDIKPPENLDGHHPDLAQKMFIRHEEYSLNFIDNSEDNCIFNEM